MSFSLFWGTYAMPGRRILALTALCTLLAPLAVPPALAQGTAPLLRDSFPIGDSTGTLCQVQTTLRDSVATGMFERSWLILCRDAAQPVGYLRLLRDDMAGAEARIGKARPAMITCRSFGDCTIGSGDTGWTSHALQRGDDLFVVEGYAAYGDALKLALASVADNAIANGPIQVATTSAGSSDGFARDLAGNIDIDQALGEGYRRNHSGDYADAAEFFEALGRRPELADADTAIDPSEFVLNRALQRSNLGEFAEADRLFDLVDQSPTADIVQQRLRRNYRAIHALNQRQLDTAAALLSAPLPPVPSAVIATETGVALTPVAVAGLNSGASGRALRQTEDEEKLTPQERAQIIDAQALHLGGTTERLRGNPAAAKVAQIQGLGDALKVRDGRVTSIIRLRSQMLGEIALAEEALGNPAEADARFVESVTLLGSEYPETAALASARARHAAFMVRQGRKDEALALYRTVVAAMAAQRRTLTGMTNQMAPYFRLLTERAESDPAAIGDFFVASQLLVRPGVADTQAILARELSSGTTEGARLFRQATNLARDVERARVEEARLSQLPPGDDVLLLRREVAARIAGLARQQTETLTALSAFPQFRAIEQTSLTLPELQAMLTPGEAYVKTLVVGDAVYGLRADSGSAQIWTAGLGAAALDARVAAIRNSISARENGAVVTYPYDADTAFTLFGELFGPAAPQIAATRHIIYEGDGAMLQLPLGVLVTGDTGLAAYNSRLADPEADAFDARELAFLGRTTRTSTAVSPLAFRNARRAAPSRASRQYFGAGDNAPISARPETARTRSAGGVVSDSCAWPVAEWNKPIAASELLRARAVIGENQATLLTSSGFTDTAVKGYGDLNDYRVLHFATHGLVTAPRPDCPARPALLTSFGGEGSDGLLSFDEIFDLRIDADLVILSACDTAGAATVAATREAGVTTGGGTALDGLVRAFIGAGGRSVIASHWPVPDDYNATERLIGGLFSAPAGSGIADALLAAQGGLMRDVRTSHPYYWAGFAIVGDGQQVLVPGRTATESAR
jgi:tetratricopeptide (TPR) repeat protein